MAWLKSVLAWQHWFQNPSLPIRKLNLTILLAIAGIFIISAVLCLLFKNAKRKDNIIVARLLRRFFNFFITLGLVLGAIIFFRYQMIPVFSIRFWYVVWLLAAAVWLVFILKYWFKKAPLERKALEEEAKFKKYLPK